MSFLPSTAGLRRFAQMEEMLRNTEKLMRQKDCWNDMEI